MDNMVRLFEEQDCLKISPVSEVVHERSEYSKMWSSHTG